MRNLKLGLFSMLCAVFMFGITTAFDINVGPENYYGTLTLNRVNIMKSYGITGIVLDGTGYEISIASGATPGYGKISVYQICGQGGGNCKQVSQLSTTTPVMNSINDNGLVEKTNGVANKVRKTNAEGKPSWQDDATGSVSVNANNPTLTNRNQLYTIATINGTEIKIQTPANPDTWIQNTKTNSGYVAAPGSNTSMKGKVRKIGSDGNPAWLDDATGSAGTSLREIGDNDSLQPKTVHNSVSIGNNKINLYTGAGRYSYNTCPTNPRINARSPTLGYDGYLIIRDNNNSLFNCGEGYIVINHDGIGIGRQPTSDYTLAVAGNVLTSNASMNDVTMNHATANSVTVSNSISAGSATIGAHKFNSSKIGVNTNSVTIKKANLQVSGGISVGTNNSTSITNRDYCDCTQYEGTIEYNNGAFYACVKGQCQSNCRRIVFANVDGLACN